MKTLDQPEVKAEVFTRLRQLSPSSVRRWGKMTPHGAVLHLTDSLHAVTGERGMTFSAPPPSVQAFQRWFALRLPIPWPRGLKTAPENDQLQNGSKPVEFARDVEALIDLAELVAANRVTWLEAHPLLGRMSPWDWQRWAYLHFDHHLRQFGV
ncbi:MAG: DUF1569 domain-containing protein [Pleurocapsa sp. SU_196_0]|nr:DUF1569 domain-containing protein [Pleurocapsa sp. SU_196_0]